MKVLGGPRKPESGGVSEAGRVQLTDQGAEVQKLLGTECFILPLILSSSDGEVTWARSHSSN